MLVDTHKKDADEKRQVSYTDQLQNVFCLWIRVRRYTVNLFLAKVGVFFFFFQCLLNTIPALSEVVVVEIK